MYEKYHMYNKSIWSYCNIWLEGNLTKDFLVIQEKQLESDVLLKEIMRNRWSWCVVFVPFTLMQFNF